MSSKPLSSHLASLPSGVSVRDVGPRDGLQNESTVPVADRVRLVDALSRSGLRRIEAGAFVHPSAIPPMAGSEEVFAQIERVPGVCYSALVPNVRGAERAVLAGADELELVVSASSTHNTKNLKRTTEESMAGVGPVVEVAADAGVAVEGIVATSFGCPYEGDIEPSRVAGLAGEFLAAGCASVAFGDTTGMATPTRVVSVLDALDAIGIDRMFVSMHFHNTRGTGLANVLTALESGVTRFDASVGGLGGCPYVPGASGNIVTEDLVHMLEDMGIDTGVDLDALLAAAHIAQELAGRELPSQVLSAGPRTRLTPVSR